MFTPPHSCYHIIRKASPRPNSAKHKIIYYGNSLAVQWVGFCAFTAKGEGSIPGQGSSIPQTSKWKLLSRVQLFATPWTRLWNSLGQNTGMDSLSLLQGDLPHPGIIPRSPALQADSLPAEPQGKAKNTGVGSLSLLQWLFTAQESNRGLLHCRRFFTNWATREAQEWWSG